MVVVQLHNVHLCDAMLSYVEANNKVSLSRCIRFITIKLKLSVFAISFQYACQSRILPVPTNFNLISAHYQIRNVTRSFFF